MSLFAFVATGVVFLSQITGGNKVEACRPVKALDKDVVIENVVKPNSLVESYRKAMNSLLSELPTEKNRIRKEKAEEQSLKEMQAMYKIIAQESAEFTQEMEADRIKKNTDSTNLPFEVFEKHSSYFRGENNIKPFNRVTSS